MSKTASDLMVSSEVPALKQLWADIFSRGSALAEMACPYKVGEKIRQYDYNNQLVGYGKIESVSAKYSFYRGILDIAVNIVAKEINSNGELSIKGFSVVTASLGDEERSRSNPALSQLWEWHDEDQRSSGVIPTLKSKDLRIGDRVQDRGNTVEIIQNLGSGRFKVKSLTPNAWTGRTGDVHTRNIRALHPLPGSVYDDKRPEDQQKGRW